METDIIVEVDMMAVMDGLVEEVLVDDEKFGDDM